MAGFKKILIGIDNSIYSDHAAKKGFELAKEFKAHVGLVHIIEPAVTPAPTTDTTLGMPLQSGVDINTMEIMDVQNELSDNIIYRTAKKYGGDLRITHFTDYGSTADGIVNCANEFGADLVVLGTHSRSGLDRFFMGSVAEDVVRNSAVPILVIPGDEKEKDS